MIITIGGPPGSGKTTVARLLSERLGMELKIIGEFFRSMAGQRGLSLAEFGEVASKDTNIDTDIDKRTVELARQGNLILEGRLAGAMVKKQDVLSYSIWLDADLETRAKRIGKREEGDIKEIMKQIEEREQCEAKRYMDIYGIDLHDKNVYDLVIDTSDLPPEKIVDIILDLLMG
jgi:predicted cytidylate kinase